jgi:hypothetical protein
MLQAFALDHVYCPTGFFTARYNVADITAHLEVSSYQCWMLERIFSPLFLPDSPSQILFRTVDGYYLDNAIRTMSRSIAPHMVQAIGMLDASTAEQRMRVTADDVVGPLEILYDFGVSLLNHFRSRVQKEVCNSVLCTADFDLLCRCFVSGDGDCRYG